MISIDGGDRAPIFVIGNPRSGTTLLRLILTSHSAIVVPPECAFAVWWYPKYRNWSAADCFTARLEEFLADLRSSRKIEFWQLNWAALEAQIRSEVPRSYAALVSTVYRSYARAAGRRVARWGDKNNWYCQYVALLKELFPGAYFVHLVRDVRDVVCSYRDLAARQWDSKLAPRLPRETEAIVEEWCNNIGKARSDFEAFGWERVVEVRYEDLVVNTEATLVAMFEALGEAYEREVLDFYRGNRSKRLEPVELLAWKERTLEPVSAARVGRYRRELTSTEIATCWAVAGPLLGAYGYTT